MLFYGFYFILKFQNVLSFVLIVFTKHLLHKTFFILFSDDVRDKMRSRYLSNPDYNFEKVNRASMACGPMVKWAIAQVCILNDCLLMYIIYSNSDPIYLSNCLNHVLCLIWCSFFDVFCCMSKNIIIIEIICVVMN